MTWEIGRQAFQCLEAEGERLPHQLRVVVLGIGGRAVCEGVGDGLAGHPPERTGGKDAQNQRKGRSAYDAVRRHLPLNTAAGAHRYSCPNRSNRWEVDGT